MTGQRAHRGETIYEVIRSVGEGSFPPPRVHRPDIPPELESAILRAMGLDPGRQILVGAGRSDARSSPLATPAARANGRPRSRGTGAAARTRRLCRSASQPGGTVVFATPAPGNWGRLGRTPSPRSAPPANTTFGASAAQMAPVPQRSGLLGVLAVVLVGCAVAAYFVVTPARHPRIAGQGPPLVPSTEVVPSAASVAPAPAQYRVDVTANPRNAELELDGNPIGTGRITRMLAVDGAEHTLTVTAFGFAPAKLKFRDRPPPEEVSLEPAAAAQSARPPGRAIRSATS